jgi:transposase
VKTLTQLSRTADKAAKALEERDRLVEQARNEGHPIRTVAKAAGVSHQTVVNIIARNIVARDQQPA